MALVVAYRFLRDPEEPAPGGGRDGEEAGAPAAGRARAPARPVRLPRRPPRWAGARVHHSPGRAVGRPLRADRLLVGGGRRSGADAGRPTTYDVAHDLQADWLTDVAKVLTTLGSGWVTIPIAVLAAIALAAWRRWMEFWALVIGMTLTVALVPEIKGWTDRPRPRTRSSLSVARPFPAGTPPRRPVYTWLAVTLALRVVRGSRAGAW